MIRARLRQVVLWVIAVDFPVLYVGAVTVESTATAIAALLALTVAAAVAALVY